MQIDGAVVSYTLRLNYDNRDDNHSLSIALDEADVRLRKGQCDRALQKARLACSRMNDNAKVPTVISGGKSNVAE